MDEPFSALDVLTAETLRTDFLDLWEQKQLPTKSGLMVTHNIEEAVLMCNRLILLSSHPARIGADISITLTRPRDRLDEEFGNIVDNVYAALTARTIASLEGSKQGHEGLGRPLPHASVNRIAGLIEIIQGSPYNGRAALDDLAKSLSLEVDDLFPIGEALHMLEFAEFQHGALKLTAAGRIFARSDTDERKQLFREHLLRFVPLTAHICRVLHERDTYRAPRSRFDVELGDHLTRRDAERTLNAAIAWGRYAELFAYEGKTKTFSILPDQPPGRSP